MAYQGYQEDLAYIHDVGFGHFSKHAAPGLLEQFRQSGVPHGGLVVDLGCGSGIWAHELVKNRYRVMGIDQSRAMLAIAQERVPGGEFREASFFDAEIPACDAVTSLGECLNYMFDQQNKLPALHDLFQKVYQALKPGGIFIFDSLEPGQLKENPAKNWTAGDDWAVLVHKEEDRSSRQLIRRIIIFRKVGETYRRSQEIHRIRLYHRSEMDQALRQAGFDVELLHGYGDMRFQPNHVGFLAKKPVHME